ncbi:hypothetical protein QR680_000717 [Steinernema hermaphroditum]|uniref:Uncharacterized protein n=1 Tax=Steinernema hermaphroditum TaxID=289476 RepID=A0AA39GWG8_9BILA|nr:hypothetical protein QR680_000717 [Steinernema hermaphroditum]
MYSNGLNSQKRQPSKSLMNPPEKQRQSKQEKEEMSPTMRRTVPSLAHGRHLNMSDPNKNKKIGIDILDEIARRESRQSRNSVSSTGSGSTVDSGQLNLHLQKRDSRSSITGAPPGRRVSLDSTELFRKRSTSSFSSTASDYTSKNSRVVQVLQNSYLVDTFYSPRTSTLQFVDLTYYLD